jgi:hypothetical protein
MLSYLGWFKTMLGAMFFYLTPINFLLLLWTAFHTTIAPWAAAHAHWLNNPLLFMGIIIGIMLVGLILEFKFMMPSQLAFMNVQGYQHGSPFASDMQTILRNQKILMDKLGIEEHETVSDRE